MYIEGKFCYLVINIFILEFFIFMYREGKNIISKDFLKYFINDYSLVFVKWR